MGKTSVLNVHWWFGVYQIIKVGVYQIIKRENGDSVKGMSELGGAQLYKSTV